MRSASRSGFSLLEVLVALTVFAIGVTGMLTALGYHLRDISYTKDHAHAVRMATREMNGLRRLTYTPEAESEGQEGRFVWRTETVEMDIEELPGMNSDDAGASDGLKPYEMSVTVSWGDSEGGEPTHRVRMKGIELFEEE